MLTPPHKLGQKPLGIYIYIIIHCEWWKNIDDLWKECENLCMKSGWLDGKDGLVDGRSCISWIIYRKWLAYILDKSGSCFNVFNSRQSKEPICRKPIVRGPSNPVQGQNSSASRALSLYSLDMLPQHGAFLVLQGSLGLHFVRCFAKHRVPEPV